MLTRLILAIIFQHIKLPVQGHPPLMHSVSYHYYFLDLGKMDENQHVEMGGYLEASAGLVWSKEQIQEE